VRLFASAAVSTKQPSIVRCSRRLFYPSLIPVVRGDAAFRSTVLSLVTSEASNRRCCVPAYYGFVKACDLTLRIRVGRVDSGKIAIMQRIIGVV
jgi:hypothetical protein